MKKTKEISTEVKDIAVAKEKDSSVETFIMLAIEKGLPVETMERLFGLREKVKAEQAREAFNNAMAQFQGNCPIIMKEKAGGRTNGGQVAYMYAPIDAIVSQTKEQLKNNGFSYAIQTQTEADKVKVTCIVKHQLGHSEETSVEVPLGAKTGVMSAPQVVASALTFAKRYAFCNAFGIITGDEDNDANAPANTAAKKSAKPAMNLKADIMVKLKTLGVDITKKEELQGEILRLTNIQVKDDEGVLTEIINRLAVLISEKNESK